VVEVMSDLTDTQVRDILMTAKSVAVIGVSAKPDRASHQVTAYLLEQTHFTVYLINPAHTENILGQPVYPNLAALPEIPDIVDVFRKGEDMPGVFEKEFPAIAGDCVGKTWWMQLGIRNNDVAERAINAGMQVVQDRCIKVDYANLVPSGL
jgi:predicted CoA-binding protein